MLRFRKGIPMPFLIQQCSLCMYMIFTTFCYRFTSIVSTGLDLSFSTLNSVVDDYSETGLFKFF